MPCDYRRYHPDWKSIVRQIKAQAGDRCEFCGVANGAIGARDRHGDWHDEDAIHGMNSGVGEGLFGDFPKMIRIVLTVAHLNHDRDDNDPANLRCLCQKCHLSWDAEHHRKNASETRRKKRVDAGQLVLGVVQ